MSVDKTIEKLLRGESDTNIRFEELCHLLQAKGARDREIVSKVRTDRFFTKPSRLARLSWNSHAAEIAFMLFRLRVILKLQPVIVKIRTAKLRNPFRRCNA